MNKANKVLSLFIEEDDSNTKSIIDGKSKQSAKTLIYKKTDSTIKGFFTDEFWTPINAVFKILRDSNIDFVIDSTSYDNNQPPTSKTWFFTISFIDNKGKSQKLVSQLKAHGGGSVKDPLDRYDVTLIMN